MGGHHFFNCRPRLYPTCRKDRSTGLSSALKWRPFNCAGKAQDAISSPICVIASPGIKSIWHTVQRLSEERGRAVSAASTAATGPGPNRLWQGLNSLRNFCAGCNQWASCIFTPIIRACTCSGRRSMRWPAAPSAFMHFPLRFLRSAWSSITAISVKQRMC